ncbi:GntR family transcriptional regulator [Pleomorphomonas carboxyditropha]|uniref:GntR family transcriptional regulator n=1 Tax=Pleomorphomonas carboxyditropha TaxID=2023338 RepID=A0A2G9WZR9_9HYPH|nr:GntR family transcriptional regulator [Pleomorphomonas carboxyditropha]PIP00228.1 GntR family transcriptional regulator [Pleomorphomonas carboxyditropha]
MNDDLKPGAPKPEQIASVLEREIRSGKLGFGERLQSEAELVRRFSVSRNTLRKGLETLNNRGLITTRVGIGSFVTFNGKTIDDAVGWARALANVGAETTMRVLRIEVLEDAALAELIGTDKGTFIAVDRLRCLAADARPISLERSRLPLLAELESVPLRGLKGGSLRQTLHEAGLHAASGEEWADIEMLGADDAALLQCPPATAFLRTRRLSRDIDGRPIEYVVSLLNPDYFALRLEF